MPTEQDDLRLARLADVLSEAVRAGRVSAADARRIIVHELRRLNANNKLEIRPRSVGAQNAIEKYAPENPPKNGSPDALHADHYGVPTSAELAAISSVDAWRDVITRIRASIVCVTAAENYALTNWERKGHRGHDKYQLAGIEFVDPVPWTASA
jgi:hypothetical protein